MTGSRHDRLTEVFAAALDVPQTSRRQFVDDVALSASLRDELRGLLRFHDTIDAPNLSASSLHDWLTAPPPDLAPGELVGRFRIVSPLGHGGHGAVYAAEQIEPVERDVALKLLDVPETLGSSGRFAAERNAMAMLNHPSIAQIYDAGVDERGRAFLAMERVEGEPMAAWAERCKPTARQIVRIILQATDALEHAHGRGVIHRDIKPSNLLVQGGCDDAQVKIIDFGLVTAGAGSRLRRWLDDAERSTAGTPLFMAPEQAAPDAPADVRADVYGLGAVLHLLLTGTPPLDLSDLTHAGAAELFAAVRERPRRSTTCDSRDLAAICDKALARDGRYANMTALAADLGRWLAHRPVTARQNSKRHRARLYVQRHRLGVAVGATVVLLLAAGIAGTLTGYVRARRENARYREQLAGNVAVTRFFTDDLFTVATPAGLGKDVTLAELMDRAKREIPTRFAGRPRIEAELQLSVGEMHLQLGRTAAAKEMLARSRDLFAASTIDDRPQLARAHASLALAQYQSGERDAAVESARQSLAVASEDDATDRAHALAHFVLAGVADAKRDVALALSELDIARQLLEPLLGPAGGARSQMIETLNLRALVLDHAGRTDEATRAFDAVLIRSAELLGPGHPYVALAAVNHATQLLDAGKSADAVPLLERALPTIRTAFGPEHEHTLITIGTLISALSYTEQFDRALEMARELDVRTSAALGADSEQAVQATHRLAAVLLRRRSTAAEAVEPAKRASDNALRSLGENNWLTGQCFATLGYAHDFRGESAEAVVALERAKTILLKTQGPRSERLRFVNERLAKLSAATKPS